MQLNLTHHPTTPPAEPGFAVWANVDHAAAFGAAATVNIWYGIRAPAGRFVMPEAAEPGRKDGLWRTTCFEAFFLADGEHGYREWNFAPSGDWAAYDFESYREGMAAAEVGASPYLRLEDNLTWFAFGATVAVPAGPRWRLGLSAVLEETDGTKSYWALSHRNADKPDFHDSGCFVASLP